jgi:hypothetical protein
MAAQRQSQERILVRVKATTHPITNVIGCCYRARVWQPVAGPSPEHTRMADRQSSPRADPLASRRPDRGFTGLDGAARLVKYQAACRKRADAHERLLTHTDEARWSCVP